MSQVNISTVTLMTNIRDALNTDTTFQTWCTSNLGSAPSIWLGWDPRTPPQQTDCPLICILTWSDNRSKQNGSDANYTAYIGFIVYNETITESGNLTTHDGLLEVEGLREQAENALIRNKLTFSMQLDGGYDGESQPPFYESYTTVTNTNPKSHRSQNP